MNKLGELWERNNANNEYSSNIIKSIVWTTVFYLLWTMNAYADVGHDINLKDKPWEQDISSISLPVQLNMMKSNESINDYKIDTNILGYYPNDDSIRLPSINLGYPLDLGSPEYITELPLTAFDDEMKMFRRSISKILDFNIPYWCTDIFKWRREIEIKFGYDCDDVKNPTYSGNFNTHRSIIVDGMLTYFLRPTDCKVYKKRKWRDNKPIVSMNRQSEIDWLDDLDTEAFEEVYINKCIQERSPREIMRWWRN